MLGECSPSCDLGVQVVYGKQEVSSGWLDFKISLHFLATWPSTISLSGVIYRANEWGKGLVFKFAIPRLQRCVVPQKTSLSRHQSVS
jgi:hypothetical protein